MARDRVFKCQSELPYTSVTLDAPHQGRCHNFGGIRFCQALIEDSQLTFSKFPLSVRVHYPDFLFYSCGDNMPIDWGSRETIFRLLAAAFAVIGKEGVSSFVLRAFHKPTIIAQCSLRGERGQRCRLSWQFN